MTCLIIYTHPIIFIFVTSCVLHHLALTFNPIWPEKEREKESRNCFEREENSKSLSKKMRNVLLKYSVKKSAQFANKCFPLSHCQIALKIGAR